MPSLTVRYKSRKDAEMALSQGKMSFSDAALHVVWHLPTGSKALVHQVSKGGGGEEGEDLLLGVSELGGDASASADENEEEEEENQVKC